MDYSVVLSASLEVDIRHRPMSRMRRQDDSIIMSVLKINQVVQVKKKNPLTATWFEKTFNWVGTVKYYQDLGHYFIAL